MSFNIRNMRSQDGANGWEFRRELVVEVVRRHSPDILGTQEAYLPQIEQMRAALPDYETVGVGREDGGTEGEHCTLFFRRERFRAEAQGTFWFSDTPEAPGSRHSTCDHARICTWVRLAEPSGNALTVYNAHLDHKSQLAREESVRLLFERLLRREASGPLVVMGDFNMAEDNPALLQMTAGAPALQDAFHAAARNEPGQATFHGFTGRTEGERIDYIFFSPEFRVLDARIVRDNRDGRYPSDHFPIFARVTL